MLPMLVLLCLIHADAIRHVMLFLRRQEMRELLTHAADDFFFARC